MQIDRKHRTSIYSHRYWDPPHEHCDVMIQAFDCGAFEKCFSLSAIEIPSSLMEIAEDAFSNCRLLEEFKFPSSLSSCLGAIIHADHWSNFNSEVNKLWRRNDELLVSAATIDNGRNWEIIVDDVSKIESLISR